MSKFCIKITNSSKYGSFSDNFSKVNSKFCENDIYHLGFDLEFYKEQQNRKVYRLFLTRHLNIRLKDLYLKLLKKIFVINTTTYTLAVR